MRCLTLVYQDVNYFSEYFVYSRLQNVSASVGAGNLTYAEEECNAVSVCLSIREIILNYERIPMNFFGG